MADIELVIKIPEEMYKNIQIRDWRKDDRKWFSEEWRAIRNGTPLPKDHGRLKDVDKIEALLDLDKADNVIAKALKNIIESVPTIIKADKESN